MKRNSGFSIAELLVVLIIASVLLSLALTTLTSNRRAVKTDNGARAFYSLMRSGRIQAITQRQFYAVVVNTGSAAQSLTLSNSTLSLSYPAQSVSLVNMGSILSTNDETIVQTEFIPTDVTVNATSGLPVITAFPALEQSLPVQNFATSVPANTFVCYFDPSGRAVDAATNNGNQVYRIFYFSASDANTATNPTLLRAITLYGATGGLNYWRYVTTPSAGWINSLY
jgi:prepilin-type N-terminal cleavage/methylation domain-containing protein